MRRKYGIDQVSVRLVKEAPILSEEEISTPEDGGCKKSCVFGK